MRGTNPTIRDRKRPSSASTYQCFSDNGETRVSSTQARNIETTTWMTLVIPPLHRRLRIRLAG
jgi:hypothetical protein